MRLLNTSTYALEAFLGVKTPRYAILSHTWGEDEVLFEDIRDASPAPWVKIFSPARGTKLGVAKVRDAASKAAERGLKYMWVDTCCIDKSSSAELSEAINSMYQWYQRSDVCLAYLSDVPSRGEGAAATLKASTLEAIKKSRWFRRGWTVRNSALSDLSDFVVLYPHLIDGGPGAY
ncbi:putative vegetative incompatibility protein het-e-1 [Rosellinia necatrix]|uniref:Putative vegetative incompatibility protein het-e-1 n=1 Tax=Rosellinia necatrix TaxID=77044 RepID=A0A1S8AAD3_ROSNE|nr:putative vegetative incompatibility protein het-e-1 [Rosellinia necatrix]